MQRGRAGGRVGAIGCLAGHWAAGRPFGRQPIREDAAGCRAEHQACVPGDWRADHWGLVRTRRLPSLTTQSLPVAAQVRPPAGGGALPRAVCRTSRPPPHTPHTPTTHTTITTTATHITRLTSCSPRVSSASGCSALSAASKSSLRSKNPATNTCMRRSGLGQGRVQQEMVEPREGGEGGGALLPSRRLVGPGAARHGGVWAHGRAASGAAPCSAASRVPLVQRVP